MNDPALQFHLNQRMTGRRLTLTDRVKVDGLNAVYLHTEVENGRAVKCRISSPGKYESAALGSLLDAVAERISERLGGGDTA